MAAECSVKEGYKLAGIFYPVFVDVETMLVDQFVDLSYPLGKLSIGSIDKPCPIINKSFD